MERLPALREHRSFASLFTYLNFGTWEDHDTGLLVLDGEILAQMENRHKAWLLGKYRGYDLLQRFENATGIRLSIERHIGFFGQSRMLRTMTQPPEVEAAVRLEEDNWWVNNDRVFFADGTLYSRARRRQYREEDRADALKSLARAGSEDARLLGEYLNALEPNRFTSAVSANLVAAVEKARLLQEDRSRRHQLAVLRAVRDQPQPFYQPSRRGRTVRLFSLNESMLALRKEVRSVLVPDWIESDLRSAHFAIVAADWNIPAVTGFLESGRSVWEYFAQQLRLSDADAAKPYLKRALYSIIYGMKPGGVAYFLTRNSGVPALGSRFVRLPLVEEVFAARERRFRQVRDSEGARTCYDQWLSTERFSVESIVAQCAQAIELRLLSPVIHLAREHQSSSSGFSILLWQHDGFSWLPHKAEDTDSWRNRLERAVGLAADEMGIISSLESP